MSSPKRIVVAITGASGAVYAVRLIDQLTLASVETHVVVSKWGRRLLADELDIEKIDAYAILGRDEPHLFLHSHQDVGDTLASGSFLTDGMIVCPCSSRTLGEMACGNGENLIARAAAVTIKESRRLIVVPREMPTGPIDLENMLRLSRAGVIICPANPGFYLRPKSIDDLVDFVVGKLLDLVGVSHDLATRWTGQPPAEG